MDDFDDSGFELVEPQQKTEKPPETRGAYAGRQALAGLEKIPEIATDLYHTVKDFSKDYGRQFEKEFPGTKGFLPPLLAEHIPVPTSEQLRSKSEKALGYEPGAFTPETTGEKIFQLGIKESPFLVANYLTGGAAGLARGALGSAGGIIGSEVGGFPGAVIGSAAGHVIGNKLPSRYLPAKMYDKNVQEFEANKNERLIRLDEEFKPRIKEKQTAFDVEPFNLAREKDAFNKDKLSSIKGLDLEHETNVNALRKNRDVGLQEVKDKIKQRELRTKFLEETRHPEYEAAERAAGEIKQPLPDIQGKINSMRKKIEKGVETSEQIRIDNMAKQLEQILNNPNPPLEELVTYKTNLNASIYDKNLPTTVKKYYGELRDMANEGIAKIGEAHPEHGIPYAAAEAKTRELKNLKKETPIFKKDMAKLEKELHNAYKNELRDLEQSHRTSREMMRHEKFPESKEIYSRQLQNEFRKELEATQKQHSDARKEIGKETYDKLVSSEAKQDTIANKLAGVVDNLTWGGATMAAVSYLFGGGLKSSALAGLVGAVAKPLLRSGANELRVIKEVFKQHPDLLKQYWQDIAHSTLMDQTKWLNRIHDHDKQFDKYAQEISKNDEEFSDEGFTVV